MEREKEEEGEVGDEEEHPERFCFESCEGGNEIIAMGVVV